MKLSQEQLRKVRAARSPQELGELARAEGVPLTLEEAQIHFAKLHPPVGELADDELDAVAGGGCYRNNFADMKAYNPAGLAENDPVYINEPAIVDKHTWCSKAQRWGEYIVCGISKDDPDITGGYWIIIKCRYCDYKRSIRAVFLSRK